MAPLESQVHEGYDPRKVEGFPLYIYVRTNTKFYSFQAYTEHSAALMEFERILPWAEIV
jgi:hypothetical protein